MKSLLLLLVLLPGAVFAQKYNFQGEYSLPGIKDSISRLQARDSLIVSFNFRDDSVRIVYRVMSFRPKWSASKHNSPYMKWKITRQEKSYEKDKASGKEIVYEQLDVTLSDGRTIGYFQHASSLDEAVRKKLPQGLVFVHKGKTFVKSRK